MIQPPSPVLRVGSEQGEQDGVDQALPVGGAWQGMQHLRDMSSGRAELEPLDDDRHPDVEWTRTPAALAAVG